jgi:glycine betaine/proline transport system substrate-binding protein
MRTPTTRLAALLAGGLLALTGCGGATSTGAPAGSDSGQAASGEQGTVDIAVSPWVGYEANAAVLTHVLQEELGYEVNLKNLKEEVAWQGFETGEVDAIVENWGHEDLKQTYIEERGVAVEAGPTGNEGHIGWYVPQWMVEEYPGITDWRNLNKYADVFETSESGGKGQFLAGDPSFVTNDEALIRNLGLDYQVVYSGSEATTIQAARQAAAQRQPLLFYFYEPQWLHSQEEFARVELPEWTEGCDADPQAVACGYPPYELDKVVSKEFAENGGEAYQVIKNFQWSNEDQNEVANLITNEGMSPEEAAAQWAEENEETWRAWLPA